MRNFAYYIILLAMAAAPLGAQEQTGTDDGGITTCVLDDGKEVNARYVRAAVDKNESSQWGKVWLPGGSAITLFTETPLVLAGTDVPAGAYTMYLLPGKRDWKMIVSRNMKLDAPYDEKMDLVRAPMETGTLSQREDRLIVTFGHVGPKRCELNIDYGKTRAWAEFKQK